MHRRSPATLVAVSLLLLPTLLVWGQNRAARPKVRAALPKWDKGSGDFFADVFKEGVVGARPDLSKVAGTGGNSGSPMTTPGGETAAPAGGVFAWSQIISSSTIEDEVKASKKVLEEEVSTPAKFAGNGYKVARKQFSVLAMMFAIIGEYDTDVRWKADGPAARDVFARTASNCKVGTIQVFNEAKLRKAELEDLLGGSGLKDRQGEAKAVWNTVTDRAPLMQRLEMAQQTRMQPWIANKGEFKDHAEEMIHEAQLSAAFAEILKKEGMEDGDDGDYAAFCDRLKKACLDIVDAAKRDDYDKARAAVGEIDKACTECHQGYRS
ncbi:MAG TPA: hypothetical protein VL096_06340 [Pirellulaceae bacterium]|nr:hypothetical protein [Pirellulaceae bacterium]